MYDLTNFDAELAAVDGARSFTQTINPAWGENEWSVAGYAITAGSDAAVQHAASEALYQLGYRFWTPDKTTRPGTLPAGGVTLPRQSFDFPFVNMFFNYGAGPGGENYPAWQELVCFGDDRRPVGHAWPSIINRINAEDSFFDNNPGFVLGTGPTQRFDLNLPQGDIDAMAQRVADDLAGNLNAFNRASIDPNDGSLYTTDEVFGFANNVVNRLRQQVSDATLGLYAYAGHRVPVSFACPHLYVNVALGFNDLGLGYPELVRQWSLAVDNVGLRAYGDIAAWDGWAYHFTPQVTADYGTYQGHGAQAIVMETSANWTKNIIGKHLFQRYWRYGQATYADVLSDAVTRLYEGDARVADLFNHWSSLGADLSERGLFEAAEIIETMPDTWYRDEFLRYQTFAMVDYRLHKAGVAQHTPKYFSEMERNLRAASAMRAGSGVHYQGYRRQRANANVINNGRPDLAFNANPLPHWDRFPQHYTASDHAQEKQRVRFLAEVPDELKGDALVVVDTTPPDIAPVLITEATFFSTQGRAAFFYAGPGTVTVTYDQGDPDVLTFGAGLHSFVIGKAAFTEWSGGDLFLSLKTRTRMDSFNDRTTENWWMYVPRIVKGKSSLRSESNIRIVDEDGPKNIKTVRPPYVGGAVDPRTLPTGVVMVDNGNTAGFHTAGNLNPFISPTPHRMLMPFALAQREFPSMVFSGAGQVPRAVDLPDTAAI